MLSKEYAGTLKFPPAVQQKPHKYSKFVITHSLPLGYKTSYHNNCIHNELVALVKRHGIHVDIGFNKKLWHENSALHIVQTKLQPHTYGQIIDRYDGAKKKRYINALAYLRENGLKKKHFQISMFVKADKAPYSKIVTGKPRAIQFRSEEYNLALSRYIAAFEEYYYANETAGVVSGTRVIAKGLNPCDRASLFLSKIAAFNKPQFIMGDHSTFDAYVNVDHLKTTHKRYLGYLPSNRLRFLLSKQLYNTGRTYHGIKYKIAATRMSGDPDTGCGNTVINIDAILLTLRLQNIVKYDFMLDGDDFVLILEREQEYRNLFHIAGFKTKLEVTECPHRVEFCQARMIYTPTPKFVRSFERCVSNSRICRKNYATFDRWMAAVGVCENSMYGDVPLYNMWHVYAQITDDYIIDRDLKWRLGDAILDPRRKLVTPIARDTYYQAFGTNPQVQIELESMMHAIAYRESESYRQHAKPLQSARSARESLPDISGSSWWQCSPCCSGPCCAMVVNSPAAIQHAKHGPGVTPCPRTGQG